MARTKTSEQVNVQDKKINSEEKADLEQKLIESEKEKNEMMKMIKDLQMQMQMMTSMQMGNQVTIKQNEDLTRTVKVTCLIDNTYNLSTEPLGRGKVFTFKHFGETKNIMFTDMQKILETYKKDFEIGRAILGSKKDYEDLQLSYIYDKVLNKEKLEELISLQDSKSVDIILNLNKDIQDDIINLIAKKMSENFAYDYNKIKELEDNGFEIIKISEMLKQEV